MKTTASTRLGALVSLIFVTILVVACSDGNQQPYSPPEPGSKKIVLKASPTEQRLSFDFLDKQSIRSRAKTVYYLVAEDGTAVEVGLSDYAKAKEGDLWTASPHAWRQVP